MRPGFAAVAVLTLALGIGSSTALFGVLQAVLLRPLPYADGDRLVHLRRPAYGIDDADVGFSVPDVEDFRARQRSLVGLAEYHSMTFNLLSRGEPLRVQTRGVSGRLLRGARRAPAARPHVRPGDDAPDAPPVVVVSHAFWQSRSAAIRRWSGARSR
jgi:hypothetical protein